MRLLVTVDWDFFVPEDPLWDIQHAENPMFLNLVWKARTHLMDKMSPDGTEGSFWPWLMERLQLSDISTVFVSESHVSVWTLLSAYDAVLLIDQHHDCWGDPDKVPERVRCDTWMREFLRWGKMGIWVKPDWLDESLYEFPEDLADRMVRTTKSRCDAILEWAAGRYDEIDVHVCRSGCWTPPWLDKAFIQFVYDAGGDIESLDDDDVFQAMEPRWEDKDIEEAERIRAVFEANDPNDALKKLAKPSSAEQSVAFRNKSPVEPL